MPKITALPAAGSVTGDDLVAIVNDPGGTPVTQKATVSAVVGVTHAHAIADVTSLQATLDGKEPANANIQAHVASAHAPSNAQKNSDITKAEIEAKLTGEISSHTHAGGGFQFPVGWVLMSFVDVNPVTFLGYGTWVKALAGRVFVGQDTGQTEFDTLGETGGAKTHTLTTTEIPAHNHQILRERSATTGGATTQIARTGDTSSTVDTNVFTENAGGGGAHNNLQPYGVGIFWERTA